MKNQTNMFKIYNCSFQTKGFFEFGKNLFKLKKENHFLNKSFWVDIRINNNLNTNFFIISFTLLVFSLDAYSQSFPNRSNLILRSNIQSNTAATTLGSPKNNNVVKAQYVFGQTPLLGNVSLDGVEIRQGFIQPLTVSQTQSVVLKLTVNVYPNPFVDRIQIDFDSNLVNDAYTSLYDMRGRLVSKKHFKNPSNRIELDLSQFANGKYVLVVNAGTQTFTKHIIKNN